MRHNNKVMYEQVYIKHSYKFKKSKGTEKESNMGVKVLLNSVDKVKDFIDITRSVSYDIDLISGRDTYLDAKSLLGVLSCDCTKPLTLDIHAEMEERRELMERLEEYVVA